MIGATALSSVASQATSSATESGPTPVSVALLPQVTIAAASAVVIPAAEESDGLSMTPASPSASIAADSGSLAPDVVQPAGGGLTASVTPSPATIDVGQSSVLALSISSGVPPYTWTFQVNGSATNISAAWPTYTFTPSGAGVFVFYLNVTDSGSNSVAVTGSVTVNAALTAPAAPTSTATALDINQALTISGTIPSTGTPTYSWSWLVSVNGGSYATATHCSTNSGSGAIAGAGESCTIAANTLTVGDTYAFELKVTDGASTPQTTTSPASPTVTVRSALTASTTPSLSAAKIDIDQLETVSATLPATGTSPYSWEWETQLNGAGGYSAAAVCTIGGGSGASGGATETCSIASNVLTAGTTYKFELVTNDSASTPESTSSAASATLTASAALTAPAAPTPSVTSLGAGSPLTVTGSIPTTGTSHYSWQWLISVNGGAFLATTQCAVNGGSGANAGATETCTVPGNTLAASTTYQFELKVTDSATVPESQTSTTSATVTTTAALTAGTPTPSTPTIDNGQSVTLTANPSGGSPGYVYQWYSGTSASGCIALSAAIPGATTSSYSASPTATTYYCYTVNDTVPNTATSAAAMVAVNSALTGPAAPTVSATVLDVNQALTVSGTIPSTGTGPYQYEWIFSTGSGFSKATMCSTPSGTGVVAATPESCSIALSTLTAGQSYTFELLVNDSAYLPESATSLGSSAVAVSSALTAPSAPTASATKLDFNQALTVSGTIPSTGSSTYSWQWLVEINGVGGYVASTLCSMNSGSGALASAPESCAIAASTLTIGDTYSFELKVTDGATTPEVATSTASSTVTVKSTLVAPSAPTPASSAIDVNQALSVTDQIPSTGSSTYSWQWLISINGAAFAAATQCASNNGAGAAAGATETCTIAASTLTVGNNYAFELKVTDGATSPEIVTSPSSAAVPVSSALTAPAAATLSATKLDLDQGLTASGTIPSTGTSPYSWQWLISVNSAAYVAATECAVNSGSGAAGTTVENCVISAGSLTVGDTYKFELKVTDSASTAESATSPASAQVAVSSALTAPTTPTITAPALDVNQVLGASANLPSTGSSTYSWQWLISTNGGAPTSATQCATNSGSGASGGAAETCTIAAGGLAAGNSYTFELQATDSATNPEVQASSASPTVTVSAALTSPVSPTPSASKLDVNQGLTITGTIPSTGSPTYSWQWLVSVNGAAYAASTLCLLNSGSGATAGATETCTVGASSLTTGDNYAFELRVTDGATTPEVATSSPSTTVAVQSALTAPGAPTTGASALDANQALTVGGTIPSTGTSTYSWQWLVSINTGAYTPATQCSSSSGSGASGGVSEPCIIPASTLSAGSNYTFELEVSDSATVAESQTSLPSALVTVSAALAAAVVSVAPATIDSGQLSTLSTTASFSGGTPTYTCQWLEKAPGGAYIDLGASFSCTAGSTPTVSGTLTTVGVWNFELEVTDHASSPETATSVAVAETVDSALVAPVISVAPTTVDVAQISTLTTSTPFSGGTPTYTCQWLEKAPGGNYADLGASFACTAGSAPNTAGPLAETGTYHFELQVTDSSGTPATVTSNAVAVTVDADPTVTATPAGPLTYDVGQSASTLTASVTYSGPNSVPVEWYSSTAASCSSSSTDTGVSGSTLTPTTSATGTTYYCAVVSDSGVPGYSSPSNSVEVEVGVALSGGTPTPTSPTLDNGQSILLTADPAGGSGSNTFVWYSGTGSGPCTGSSIGTASSESTGSLSVGTHYFCYVVTDSDLNSVSSAWDAVTVNAALTAPVISIAPTTVDVGQLSTITTGTSFSGGTATYTCQWLEKAPGGSFLPVGASFACSAGGEPTTGGSLASAGTWEFELQVTDSSATPASVVSNAAAIVVDADPTVGVSPTGLLAYDVGQTPATLTAAINYSGPNSAPVEWFSSASTVCNSGTTDTGVGGTVFTPSTSSAGVTYYCAVVSDSGVPLYTSVSSPVEVEVGQSLLAGTPTPTSPTLDTGQSISLTANPSGGSTPYTVQWYNGTGSGPCTGTPLSIGLSQTVTPLAAGMSYYCYVVTDSVLNTAASAWDTVTEDGSPSILVQPGPATIDAGQTATLTATVIGGTGIFSWQWYDESGAIVGASGMGTTATYGFSVPDAGIYVVFTDTGTTVGASPTVNATSSPTVSVTVNPVLTAPSISVNLATLDSGEGASLSTLVSFSGGTSTYSCQWLAEAPGSGYVDLGGSFPCALGATPSSPTGALTATGTWSFELAVTDSSDTPVTIDSAPVSVLVNAALAAPTISAAPPALDSGQSVSLSTTVAFSGGTSSYTCQWLEEAPGAGFTDLGSAFGCTEGATPELSTGELATLGTWHFELQVTDSSDAPVVATSNVVSVTVNPNLVAPAISISPSTVDSGQSSGLATTAAFGGGTSTYSCQWLEQAPGGSFTDLGSSFACTAGSLPSIPTGALTATGNWHFELEVTDSSATPETVTSDAVALAVNSALTAPGAPAPSATKLDVDQPLELTVTLGSSGTPTYSWLWLASINGGTYANATQCIVNVGTGAVGGATETCTVDASTLIAGDTYAFELEVFDNASTPQSQTSATSGPISVSPALTAPAAPRPSATTIATGETLTISGTVPSTGTSTYSWDWLVSIDSAAYGAATQCAVHSGTGASNAAVETCTIPAGTLSPGGTYSFEFRVSDSASAPEIATSPASFTVTVTALAPMIEIGPAQGPVGATYVVTGSGFLATSSATFSFAASPQTPSACSQGTFSGPTITTNASGGFVCTFMAPNQAAGSYALTGEDSVTQTVTESLMFTITTPLITVTPAQASPGTAVTVAGTGFSVATTITSLLFDSVPVSTCASGSLTTSSSGTFTCTFSVPSGTSGTTVTVTDPGGESATTTFTTTAAPTASSGFPWIWIVVAAVILALIVASVFAVRRRRGAARGGPREWEEPAVGGVVAASPAPWEEGLPSDQPADVPPPPPAAPAIPDVAPAAAAVPAPVLVPGTASAPLAPSRVPLTPAPAAPAEPVEPETDPLAAALAAVPVSEPEIPPEPEPLPPRYVDPGTVPKSDFDIDSIFAELDAISGQILKPPPKKESGGKPAPEDSDPADESSGT